MVNEILFKLISKNEIGKQISRHEAFNILEKGGSVLVEECVVFFKFNNQLYQLIANEVEPRKFSGHLMSMSSNKIKVLPLTGEQLHNACNKYISNSSDYWDYRCIEEHVIKSEKYVVNEKEYTMSDLLGIKY